MRSKNPARMEKIMEYINAFYTAHRRMPSTTEIGKEFGIVRSTAYKYLVAMDEKGMLKYQNGEIATVFTDSVSPDAPMSAIYNESISCGPLEGVEATVDEYVHLPASIFGDQNMYIIRTHGDSMIEAGIEPGDLVVVEQRTNARPGNIVVALTEEGNTLKTLGYDDRSQKYYLHPENSAMADIQVDALNIQGVASFVIKKLNKN